MWKFVLQSPPVQNGVSGAELTGLLSKILDEDEAAKKFLAPRFNKFIGKVHAPPHGSEYYGLLEAARHVDDMVRVQLSQRQFELPAGKNMDEDGWGEQYGEPHS